jgi:hypothetical protein
MTERNELDELTEEGGWRKGQRVRLTTPYSGLPAGSEGTITWLHPKTLRKATVKLPKGDTRPYIAFIRVQWDDAPEYKPGQPVFGMDDYGWLQYEDELELVPNREEGDEQ